MRYRSALVFLWLLHAAALSQPLAKPPRCIDADAAIVDIRAAHIAHPKSPAKYDGYRALLTDATPHELAARLAYAETLAANCPARNEAVAQRVAAVIGNRVRIRGKVDSVVFQRDQFASSLNIYPESRYRDFLCPRDAALWNVVAAAMRAELESPQPVAPVPPDAVNYYLYRHSDRFRAPDWQLAEVPVAHDETRECIRVFRNPRWK